MYIHYIICIYFLRKSKRQTVQSTNSSIYELLNKASTLPERRSTFAPRASCTKRQQTPQLCLCFAGPLEMGAAEGLPIFLPRCLLSCFFFVFKNSELMSGIFAMCWQIHTDAVLPPPMLLQRWFGPVFKSISSAKKDKQDRPKNLRTIWKVEDATPAYVN